MKTRIFFLALFVLLLAARLCHLDILWAEETLPLAAAGQMLHGKILYRDLWFDKPPLLAFTYLAWGAHDGFALRLAGALYALLACWIAWRFARDLWGRREALWSAGLLAFYLVFDIPSSVTPLATDLLMLAPHLAAVWLAWRGRAFWSGVLAGIAFLVNAKGVFVLAACALWDPRALPLLLAGFAIPNALAAALLWSQGSLGAYYEQVWKWGRLYVAGTFVASPWANAFQRTAHWLGFHAAIVIGAMWFWWRSPKADRVRWAAWAAICCAAVAAGGRFFPRYYFQLLPLAVLAGARGLALLGRRRALAVSALLLVPLVRFGPRYALLGRDMVAGRRHQWVDLAMDRDSRQAAQLARQWSAPGNTLFVWGFRPELYVYTGLAASTRFLDSQPLTGVPADRHLTAWQPVDNGDTRAHRAELRRTHPTFIVDGLGPINPRLAIGAYADLGPWLAEYEEVGRTGLTVIYRRRDLVNPPSSSAFILQLKTESSVIIVRRGVNQSRHMTAREQRPYLNTREDPAVRFLGIPTVMRSTGETTNGAFGLIEHLTIPPGWASPYHTHHLEDEAFYVLEGEVAFVCDGKWLTAGPGAYVFGPREIPHGFKIAGAVPARMLVLCAPAGFERFILEMSEPAPDLTSLPPAPDMERLMAVAAKYKIDILGPLPEQPAMST